MFYIIFHFKTTLIAYLFVTLIALYYVLYLQLLTIHLDESDCFSSWMSAKELGMIPTPEGTDQKCRSTFGKFVITSVFSFWYTNVK